MDRVRWVPLVVSAIVVLVVVIGQLTREAEPEVRAVSTTTSSTRGDAPPDVAAGAPAASSPDPQASAPDAPPAPPPAKAERDRTRADALRKVFRAIATARDAARAAHDDASDDDGTNAARAPTKDADAPGQLDPQYIKDAMKELVPLLKECHQMATADGGVADGKLVVSFEINGDPELGGVIGASAIDAERSTLTHPMLEECVRETVYGMVLPAPENGGVVTVNYPLVFSSGDAAP